jgi:hypothetical protein
LQLDLDGATKNITGTLTVNGNDFNVDASFTPFPAREPVGACWKIYRNQSASRKQVHNRPKVRQKTPSFARILQIRAKLGQQNSAR